MSQIFPNFTRPDSLGGPAPIQTVRVSHTLSGGEQSQGWADVAVAFPYPFADANYTLMLSGEENFTGCYVSSKLKTASGFTARVVGQSFGPGETFTIHVVAFHD